MFLDSSDHVKQRCHTNKPLLVDTLTDSLKHGKNLALISHKTCEDYSVSRFLNITLRLSEKSRLLNRDFIVV